MLCWPCSHSVDLPFCILSPHTRHHNRLCGCIDHPRAEVLLRGHGLHNGVTLVCAKLLLRTGVVLVLSGPQQRLSAYFTGASSRAAFHDRQVRACRDHCLPDSWLPVCSQMWRQDAQPLRQSCGSSSRHSTARSARFWYVCMFACSHSI